MSLAPEHLADLRASGLSDETIDALQVEAVRPADLNTKGATSAYTLPYFNFDGSANCFARRKLFPPVKTSHGTMKYWQPKDSLPHLYLPPIVDWQTAAKAVTTALTITEGEKKAAAACQHGLITAGIGGNWCHISTLDSGDTLTLPMLDEFQWANRPVLICPDSDGWGKEQKAWNILAGFFVLAKDLQGRGADVRFIVLPDLHGGKAGLDDWLLIPGHDVEQGWQKLERIALDDARFNALTAWWQKRKEKQATHEALKQHDLDALELTETAGLHTVRSSTHAVTMIFDRLTDARGGVSAEMTVVLGATELLAGVDLGLKSDTGHTKLANSLMGVAPAIPWKLLLQRACSLVLKRYREGEPLRILTVDTPIEPLTFQLNPTVFQRKPSVLFGDGGLGKSTLGLCWAMQVSVGERIAGISALPGIPLYLDYEDSYDVHVRRMQAIAAGHPTLMKADVRYQACTEPLTNLLHTLLRRIQAEKITFLILDSLAAATGGDAGAEAATKVFRAIRTLNIGTLIIAHIPKPNGEGTDPSIYGSVFHKNFARATWELRKEQDVDSDASILGLFNRKSNLSRLHLPIGLKVTQNETNSLIHYEPYDLSQTAELEAALPLASRIRNLLDDGMARTAKQIAEALGAKLGSVKATLSTGARHHKWMMLGGAGQDTQWTVLAPKNES